MNAKTAEANPVNEQLVTDLAWTYCEKVRAGRKVRMKEYLNKCPDEKSKAAFKELVNTDSLLGLMTQEYSVA